MTFGGKETVHFRTFKQHEIDQSIELTKYAFQMDLSKEEERLRQSLQADQLWGAFIDGQLAAQVLVIPLTVYIHGKKIAMGGIGNVASWPERRRGGLVAKLLTRSLEVMRDQGQSVSYLTPFSYAFYRKYGWEMFVDRKKFTLSPSALSAFDASLAPGQVERVEADSELLAAVYEQYAAQYNGMLHRESAFWWDNRVLQRYQGKVALYKDSSGTVQGYMLYQVKDRFFRVNELIALNLEARAGLMRFISMHDSMAEKVQLYVPTDDPLSLELDNPRFGQEIEPYFMARIVDVESFIRQYPFKSSANRIASMANEPAVQFTLDVVDEYAPWNQTNFIVTVDEEGKASVQRGENVAHRPGLACSIQTLSALLMGYQDAYTLYRIGRLTGEEQEVRRLAALIPDSTPFLADFF